MAGAEETHQRVLLDGVHRRRELHSSFLLRLWSIFVHKVPRRILAVVSGIGVSTGVILAVEGLNSRRYPPPAGINYQNMDELGAYIATLPADAFATVLAAWVLGTFLGGAVTARVAGTRPRLFAGIIAGVVGLGAVINIARFPHPLWMVVAAGVGVPLAYFAAVRISPNASPDDRVA